LVVLLAGGTGGAKLARGMLDVVGPERLAVVANTGDDVEVYGVHVSPDPDLVTYWLADEIDGRGWGLAGDTWRVMEALEAAGRPAWFRLGDRDLAMCLLRTAALRSGARLTEAHAEVVQAMGVSARVLPMSDDEVRTWVRTAAGWRAFQEFMIVDRAETEIEEVAVRGAERARPTPEVLEAVAAAGVVVIGPSNPVISIGPILAVGGMREAIAAAGAPVVAVSPFVGGRAVKGPTEAFVRQAGLPLDVRALVNLYGDLLHGIVADEDASGAGLPAHVTDTLMDDAGARERVARETLEFAESLPR
jgi:LPPG:FO 2-phospho-L-lactate transferase